MGKYLLLLFAIISETIGTSFLKQSDGFTKFWPSLITIAGYILSFYLLSLVLKYIPVSIAYAIWSGLGIVLIGVIGWVWFKQTLDFAAMLGMGCIIAGVLIINIFSKSFEH